MKKSSSEKKYGRKKSSEKKNLLETTSNHLLFNAPGHIKNGSRSPEESSADRPRSQGGSPSSSRKKGSDLQIRTHVSTWNLFENLNLSALWMILKGSALGFRGRDLSLAVGALELCGILTIVDNC